MTRDLGGSCHPAGSLAKHVGPSSDELRVTRPGVARSRAVDGGMLAEPDRSDNDRPVATPIRDPDRGSDRTRRRSREHTLDDVDRSIIERLQRDGRLPYTRLGAQVGLSEAAVRQRVQRLIDDEVIDIVAVSNPLKLGMRRMAMIGVRTEGPSSEVAERLEGFPDIEYLAVTAGSFDLLAEVVVGDDSALLELTNRIRAVPGVVNTETFIYLDLVKQTFAWGAH